MSRRTAAVLVALAIGVSAPPVSAQKTRAAALEQQRAERAKSLSPYQPGKLEKTVLWLERTDPFDKLSPYDGFYVQYGFMFRPTGSGPGLGAGFRHDLFNRTARVNLQGGVTTRNYQLLLADLSLPYVADGRFETGVQARYRRNPQEDFWGLGADSATDARVSFLADYVDYQTRAIARPAPWLVSGVRLGWLTGSIGTGTDSRFPSIEERYTDASAPGLAEQPDFRYTELFAEIDSRDQEDNARAGGFYALTWRRHDDLDLALYTHRQVEAVAQHFLPIFDKKRVFALQARLVASTADDGQVVPFYFKPTLGGGNTLRSVNDYRFRDDAIGHLNAEYRWEAFSGLDMALFYDLGLIAARLDDMSLGDRKSAYGIGFRFNTVKRVITRLDIGFGDDEGVRTFFKFSKAF